MRTQVGIQGKLTVRAVAELLGSSKFTLYRHIKNGSIPSLRLGRKVLLDPDEVIDAMRRGAKERNQKT